MNVVIYARYSSLNQTEQSIEGQLRDCHAYCKRYGYNVIHEYIDRALSAYKDIEKRDEFQQMIADAKKRQFEMVIVYAFDRFARNRYDSVVYKHKLKECGVKVFSITESFGTADESMPYEALLEWAAENYSRSLGKNAARGMRESALKGQTTGGHIALGFRCVDKKLVIDDDTAPAVRLCYELYASGKSKKQVAEELNNRGYRTSMGNKFSYYNITHILTNRLYIGDYTYKSNTAGEIKRTCPRIIDDDLFERCQMREKKSSAAYGYKRSNVEYILSGKLFCGECGAAMTGDAGTGRTGSTYFYYTCHNRKRYRTCKKKAERLEEIEDIVIERTLNFILKPERITDIAEKIAAYHRKDCSADKIAGEERRLAAIEKEIDGCVDALIKTTNALAIDKINDRLNILTAQKEDIETQIAKLKITAEYSLSVKDVSAWLQTFSNGQITDQDFRRRVVYAFVNSVFVYEDKVVIYYNIGEFDGKTVTFAENSAYIANTSAASTVSDSSINALPSCKLSETLLIIVDHVFGTVFLRPVFDGLSSASF